MPALPFHLATLKLAYLKNPSSFELVDALSRQSSVTSLYIVLRTPGSSPTTLFERYARLAPQLVTLKYDSYYPREVTVNFFKRFTQLKHLTIRVHLFGAVALSALSLESCTLPDLSTFDLTTVLDVLNSKSPPTARMEQLRIAVWAGRWYQLQLDPQWSELKTRCREMKIEVIHVETGGPE